MQPGEGRVRIVPDEFVELAVLLLLDLGLGSGPEGLDGVDRATVQLDREGDEVGVTPDDALDLGVLGELPGVLLQVEEDPGSPRQVGRRFDVVAARSVRGPEQPGSSG